MRLIFVDDTWIRPKDRLPKENEQVTCMVGLCSFTQVKEGLYNGTYWEVPGAFFGSIVIAWQPIVSNNKGAN